MLGRIWLWSIGLFLAFLLAVTVSVLWQVPATSDSGSHAQGHGAAVEAVRDIESRLTPAPSTADR